MTATSLLLILAGVCLNAIAQLLLKAGTNKVGIFAFDASNALPVATKIAFEPYILAGVSAYVISLVIWILALSRVPVTVAYPMLSLGYLVAAGAGWLWLGEGLTPQKLCGLGLILAGVLLVARS